ncbi:MAG: amidohydrolase family protein [Chloroflexota bacterium]|nr:amidohydrolase family protein [Chloroflexota bacterium]
MILDSHAHIDVVPSFGWFDTAEKLIGMMDEAGVSMAAVSGYYNLPGPNPESIQLIAEAVQKYPDRIIGYIRLDPWFEGKCLEQLDLAVKEYGIRGVKLHPAHYTLHPFGDQTVRLARRAGEYGIPMLFHSGDEMMCLPYQIDRLAAQAPETTIILAHTGGFFSNKAAIEVARRRENVYVDTCEIPLPRVVKQAVQELGAEKVLFGTDAPCCDIKVEIRKVELAGLSQEEERLVFFENYANLMGIELPDGDEKK